MKMKGTKKNTGTKDGNMREVIEEVLERYSHLQPNMASKTLRETLAEEIERALIENKNANLGFHNWQQKKTFKKKT